MVYVHVPGRARSLTCMEMEHEKEGRLRCGVNEHEKALPSLGRQRNWLANEGEQAEHVGDLVELDGAQESHSAFVLCVPTATRFLPGCACADIKKIVILGLKSS